MGEATKQEKGRQRCGDWQREENKRFILFFEGNKRNSTKNTQTNTKHKQSKHKYLQKHKRTKHKHDTNTNT